MDDDGFPQLGGETELGLEHTPLRLRCRVVAEPVEARLPHRDRLRMLLQPSHLVDVAGRGLVRMDPDDRPDLGEPLRELDRLRGADGEDARHACFPRPLEDVEGILVERVEVRVRVDHRPRRASSSAAVSGGSLRKSGAGSRSGRPGSSSLGFHSPTQLA